MIAKILQEGIGFSKKQPLSFSSSAWWYDPTSYGLPWGYASPQSFAPAHPHHEPEGVCQTQYNYFFKNSSSKLLFRGTTCGGRFLLSSEMRNTREPVSYTGQYFPCASETFQKCPLLFVLKLNSANVILFKKFANLLNYIKPVST